MSLGIREGRDDQLDRAAAMPHRSFAGVDRLDARLECTIGRLFFAGMITESQYHAGIRYGSGALEYIESIDAPDPYGADLDALTQDACYDRKIYISRARDVLRRAAAKDKIPARNVIDAVDAVTIYGESPGGEKAWRALRIGLSALAGEG